MKKPELLAPTQDFTSLSSAIQAGADAIYFGIRGFNMRAGAKNFTASDLKKITKICHKHKVKTYLALNTIIYEDELKNINTILKKAKSAKIDAVICWDLSVVTESVKLGIETHLSTQASVSNSTAAKFYKQLGIKRVILARECSLDQIKKIKKQSGLEIETFIHGAMCVSVSGRCFLSQFLYGKSANRGECLQPCRREYKIMETENTGTNKEKQFPDRQFTLGNNYILSPKDLCTLPFIEKLMEAKIDCFKIEGRNRSPEYVYTVTKTHRELIDFYFTNKKSINSQAVKKEWGKLKKEKIRKLETVYNRDFSSGFYLGKPIDEWSDSYGSRATMKKIHLGKVTHFYSKIKVAEIKIEAKQEIKIGDTVIIQGEKTGHYSQKINSMEINHKKIKIANQGDIVAIKTNKTVKTNDQVFLQKLTNQKNN